MIDLEMDRRAVATVQAEQNRIYQRLAQLEYVMQMSENKPKAFEMIDNKLADMRADMAQNQNEALYRVGCCDNKIEALTRDVKSALADIKSMESMLKLRDEQN